MPRSRFIVGIDLGTTNSAVAYVDLGDQAERPPIRLFSIPQLVDAGKVTAQPGLPSFLYLPGPHDLPDGSIALPWDTERGYAVGVFARDQGALVPTRLVASAKSWLCHAGVDRQAPILPWGSPSEVPHLSPVEASQRYLQHLREAWDRQMSQGRSEWTIAGSEVVLTVPASFDEAARELTVEAARSAGLERLTLLEEPQAAFYSWVRSQGEEWHEQLSDGQTILVCDVGGGTTDFSLISVHGQGPQMSLSRVAVGDHLMLGGDNMDLALARHLESRLLKRAGELSAKQWNSLVHCCREGKESLLGASAQERHPISIAGSGSKVIGGSLRIDLHRDEVNSIVLDGFFPLINLDDTAKRARPGLSELGLPYANDPAVTRNLAAFLKRHRARPDAVLFNGGAMKSSLVQDRVVDNLGAWFDEEPEVLESRSLDLAVALGAATYGLVRAGGGVRIRAGTARAYYVGVQREGSDDSQEAVCLVPFGVEEGNEVTATGPPLKLLTDRPVTFPLFSSTAPLGHEPGDVVQLDEVLFRRLPPIHTVLNQTGHSAMNAVPVQLVARLNEIGTLDLWCAAVESAARWNLSFSLRAAGEDKAGATASTVSVGDATVSIDEAQVHDGGREIAHAFSSGIRSTDQGPKTLAKRLENLIGVERLRWPGPLLRRLWTPLWQVEGHRSETAEAEAAWLNLAGILLRPGFGDPLDGERIEELWRVFRGGLKHEDTLWCRVGWWVLWRRVSGGLSKGQQLELSNKLAPPLLSGAAVKAVTAGKSKKGRRQTRGKKSKGNEAPGFSRQELTEMWRAVASLEHVPAASKAGLGDVALRNAVAGRGDFAFWALGRLGARLPLYGPLEETCPRDKVESWLERLLTLEWSRHHGVALAVVQLARKCGDDARDVDDGLRQTLVQRLQAAGCAAHLVKLVTDLTVLREEEKAQLFGDALPAGLRL